MTASFRFGCTKEDGTHAKWMQKAPAKAHGQASGWRRLGPGGRYAASPGYFATPRTVGPLTAPSGDNGVYRYGAGGGFPAGSFNSTNYFVDVVFRATSP